MFVQFLVEDISGGKFLQAFMENYNAEMPEVQVEYDIKPYRGIGNIPKGANAKNNKSGQLLSDLPKRLRAFNAALMNQPDACVVVVLDNDTRDTEEFYRQLNQLAEDAQIVLDRVFCIAVEEMEAWLLGDRDAIIAAFPDAASRISTKLLNYQQDSICGTWEILAEVITKGGMTAFRKKNPTSHDIGLTKSAWAERIGKHISIRKNKSPSFQQMVRALDARREACLSAAKAEQEKTLASSMMK
ncbi:MAG: DUF4276 family protein [Ruminococcaceae bacterium]|nr:DUF4276 family protein [Oscillospiraceae bacterium]